MLNPLNYGRLEACQRLHAAGIVLETEKVWALNEWLVTVDNHVVSNEEWKLIDFPMISYKQQVPAPSMVEVWRELLGILSVNKRWYELRLIKVDDITQVGYWWLTECLIEFQNRINPADALIDLLIWVEQRKEEKSYD